MTPAEREAAQALYAALAATPCYCDRENGKVVSECWRCAAMWKWERVELKGAVEQIKRKRSQPESTRQ